MICVLLKDVLMVSTVYEVQLNHHCLMLESISGCETEAFFLSPADLRSP